MEEYIAAGTKLNLSSENFQNFVEACIACAERAETQSARQLEITLAAQKEAELKTLEAQKEID